MLVIVTDGMGNTYERKPLATWFQYGKVHFVVTDRISHNQIIVVEKRWVEDTVFVEPV